MDASPALIVATVPVKGWLGWKMSVSYAKKQKISRAMKWFMSGRRSAASQSAFSSRLRTY